MDWLDGLVLVDLQLQFVDEILQNIFSRENDIDDFRIEEQATRAGGIQKTFQLMRKAVDRHEAQESRCPLERVEGSKNRAEHLRVIGPFFKNQYALLDIFKVLTGLIDKLTQDIAIALQVHRGVFIELIRNWHNLGRRLSTD